MSQEPHPDNAPWPPGSQWRRAWHTLPLAKRYPVIAGAIAGVLLRLVFSGPAGSRWSAMAESFIYIVPIVVGMVTVYLAERQRRRDWAYYIAAPCLATALFVAGTMLIMIEGLICAIVIIPMFAVLGVLGGHYFDLIDTSYTLSPEGKATRLTTRVHYRISTQFNFYADWAAQFLLGNLCEVGLHLYKARSEGVGTEADGDAALRK